jgi:hypothetical protein
MHHNYKNTIMLAAADDEIFRKAMTPSQTSANPHQEETGCSNLKLAQ